MAFKSNYSRLDRLIHRIAFSSRSAQIAIADAEDGLLKSKLKNITLKPPVFVAGLPRAGTTLLLEILESNEEFFAHTYQDMPFILTPVLWAKVANKFRKEYTEQERAHGDGMMVGMESPEAFEEVLWAAFWKQQYQPQWVTPWVKRLNYPEFQQFFCQHMKKIAYLRRQQGQIALRYLSKNNMNIGRLDYIHKIFPDATLLVPFRHPLQQAASLQRQHLNFLKIHREDSFARDYMRAIGHYDFGDNLKPINFSNWVAATSNLSATELTFWLKYWVEAYQAIEPLVSDRICLLSYDQFCEKPKQGLSQIADCIGLTADSTWLEQTGRVMTPKSYDGNPESQVSDALLSRAMALYDRLNKVAINCP